jgi:hypothetical protein
MKTANFYHKPEGAAGLKAKLSFIIFITAWPFINFYHSPRKEKPRLPAGLLLFGVRLRNRVRSTTRLRHLR